MSKLRVTTVRKGGVAVAVATNAPLLGFGDATVGLSSRQGHVLLDPILVPITSGAAQCTVRFPPDRGQS